MNNRHPIRNIVLPALFILSVIALPILIMVWVHHFYSNLEASRQMKEYTLSRVRQCGPEGHALLREALSDDKLTYAEANRITDTINRWENAQEEYRLNAALSAESNPRIIPSY